MYGATEAHPARYARTMWRKAEARWSTSATNAGTTRIFLAQPPCPLVETCHNRDIPPQPSHTYLCLLAVQTPPEQSLIKPEPIPGLPNPSIAFPNSSAAFLKGCCQRFLSKHSRSDKHHSQTHLTILDEPETSQIPLTNPELARSPLNLKTQYAQP